MASSVLIDRIRRHFQVALSFLALFASPTIAEMASVITQQQASQMDSRALHAVLTELEAE